MSIIAIILLAAAVLGVIGEALALITRRWPETISERWKALIHNRWWRLGTFAACGWVVWHIYFEDGAGYGPPVWWDDVVVLLVVTWAGIAAWRLRTDR